jgi:hypothetical protein
MTDVQSLIHQGEEAHPDDEFIARAREALVAHAADSGSLNALRVNLLNFISQIDIDRAKIKAALNDPRNRDFTWRRNAQLALDYKATNRQLAQTLVSETRNAQTLLLQNAKNERLAAAIRAVCPPDMAQRVFDHANAAQRVEPA